MIRSRFILAGLLLASLSAAQVYGIVGVNDACPVPTPYPPPSAGAGVINNRLMEGGFTNGAANQWVAFKAAGLAGQVHYAGSDRPYSGIYSQKFNLPQPTSETQAAGIYQQVWVVPGGTYTVTAKIYLQFAPETYNGEDLIANLGLDPFGQDSGRGGGMIWCNDLATKNTWLTATVTAQARNSVMTVSFQAIRKWAQHGNGALAWIDEVTFSGPVPTGTRPGPEPDPIDPETLIPPAAAPNLLANPSFEDFSGNLAVGWNAWTKAGSGTWKRSRRIGKVGPGHYGCGWLDSVGRMNGKTMLFFGAPPSLTNPEDPGGNGTFGDIAGVVSGNPELEDSIVVGRPYIDGHMNTYLSDPVFYGRQLAYQMYLKQQQFPRIDCWQGGNEPDTGSNWQNVVTFEKAFTDRAHELGMKTVVLNLSTGSPGNIWRMVDESFDPSCHDLLEAADYLGHHVYGGPADDLMVTNQVKENPCDFALRPRRFKDMYDRRGWRFPPVIATEGNSWGGRTDQWGDARMSSDLTVGGDYMNANNWWCGYTHFVVGDGCGWAGFEIGDHPAIVQAVADWNYNHPADAKQGLYSQMFGAGKVHPRTSAEAAPAGLFDGGVNRQVSGLTPGLNYVAKCWMKYEFRGAQPSQLKFYIGIDPTGQTANPSASTIDWGSDHIAQRRAVHEIFTHAWRTFTATSGTASVWLRAAHPVSNPSYMVYVDNVEVRKLDQQVPVPAIILIPASIDKTVFCGANAAADTLTLRSAESSLLTYSVSESCSWVSVQPTSGSVSTEQDALAILYNTADLPPGMYTCAISVSSPGATNSPQTLTIQLNVLNAQADFDRDCDVDLEDFGHLQECLSGPGITQSQAACLDARIDLDDDVDADDALMFLDCFSGPGRPVPPACGP